MQHDDLNNWLNGRAVPKAPPGLSERIIHAAVSGIKQQVRKLGWWEEIFMTMALPRPSVVLVGGVVLGLLMGIQASDGLAIFQQDWSSFLDINEGGWL